MRKILYIFGLVLVLMGCDKKGAMEPSYDVKENMDALWTIMDERYCFFEEKNINWDSVHTVFKMKQRGVKNVYDLFKVMSQMVGLLNDGHINIYTPFAISSCNGWYDDYPTDFSFDNVVSTYLKKDYLRINGLYYDTIVDVGYIYVSSFSNSIAVVTMQYIDYYFQRCKGIVIDVRSNGGGDLTVSESLAACMFKEKTLVGYIKHKTGAGHNDFSEPEEVYVDVANRLIDWSDKKVVVLTNRRAYSSTNDFVNMVSYAKNVKIVGGKTGGGGGMPLSRDLPIGWMVRFSAVPSFNREMKSIDGGIDPDEFVHIEQSDYDEKRDPILERAMEIIRNEE